jgi:hypothetical protein
MSNWRTVNIFGTVDAADLTALREAVEYDSSVGESRSCLGYDPDFPTLCGLYKWPSETIAASGNLAEDAGHVECVEAQLRMLLSVAPSLNVVVHCGNDCESDVCIASVVAAAGKVAIHPPQVENLVDIPDSRWDVM